MPIFENIEETELYLVGDIGFEDATKNFVSDLKKVKSATVIVHIDSVGGKTTDSISIYNALREFTGYKIAMVDGCCMSAASYILMAFDKVIAKPNALFMIHCPLVEDISGNADELSVYIESLKRLENIYIKGYSNRLRKTEAEIKALMQKETYFNATEAYTVGLVDKIATDSTDSFKDKETLLALAQERVVAFNKHFKIESINTMEEIKPIEENKQPIENENNQSIEENKTAYSLAEAQAVLDTAKEINTKEAYQLAFNQISDAIKSIEDKSIYESILKELEELIASFKDEIEEEQPEEPKPVEKQSEVSQQDDKERRAAIVDLAKKINNNRCLDNLIIESLAGDTTIEDFKTKALEVLAINNAKANFKSVLFASKASNGTKTVDNIPTLKNRNDYIAYYYSLKASNPDKAKSFKSKYKNIL